MRYAIIYSFLFLLSFSRGFCEQDALQLARTAFQNRLLELAELEFRGAIAKNADMTLKFEAYLGLAKVYVSQNRLKEATALFSEFPEAPGSLLLAEKKLLEADILLLQGDPEAAEASLKSLPNLSGELEINRKRLQARSLVLKDDLLAAIGLLSEGKAVSTLPAVLQFDIAELFYDTGRKQDALKIWKWLAENPATELVTQQSWLALAKYFLEDGSAVEARKYLDKLLDSRVLKEELEQNVYPVLIDLLVKEGFYLEAAEYLSSFEEVITDPAAGLFLKALRAQNLILGGEVDAANRLLQELIALRGNQPEIAQAQLLLARTLMNSGKLEPASVAYQNYLSVFSDPDGLLEAETGLASTYEGLGEFAKAELFYEKIYNKALAESELKPLMLLKWADMAFVQNKTQEAIIRYQEFISRYPEHEGIPQAMLQISTAIAESGSLAESLEMLTRIRLRFPDTPFAEKALIQRAILLQKGLRPEQALGAYDSYLELYPEGRYVADAITDKGITAYRLGLFDLALRQFREVSQSFPDSPRVEQAQSLVGWTFYLMGDDESARRAGKEFLQKYAESSYAPDVRFWLAEIAYNHGEFPQAASEFQKLAQTPISKPLLAKAHYLAGRSLLADKKLDEALKEFSLSRDVSPDALFAADALFYMGDSLTELGRFDEAILVFDQLIRENPESYLVNAARGRMGDCQYTLGEEDPSRYLEALNSYKLVEENKDSSFLELRLQAMYKVGRTLNALDRKKEAQRQLVKMIQIYMDKRREVGEEAATWFLRAVADVAQSYEQAGEYREAMKIYEQLRNSGLPQAAEGARRYEDLRREHRILF